ncbi:MAG: nitroreductase family protein [Chloroflexi bacterium]|nr:nitroreductase family protein [Chloroflexota bacterium]MYE31554.1 nitroreductase family protein [Chloroflexota bacterium]
MKPIEDAGELFRRQRAVRAWSDREVDDETVRAVLQAAIHAPSGSNTQPWSFIVVRDPEQKVRIREVYDEAREDISQIARVAPVSSEDDRQPLDAAPVLIVACVRTPPSGRAGFQTGASIYPACQNLMLAARALGLGTVLTTLHRRRKDELHEVLGIPEGIESAAIIPLGWPTRDYGPNRRAPLDNVVMHERWTESPT